MVMAHSVPTPWRPAPELQTTIPKHGCVSSFPPVFGFREFCSDLPAGTSRISPMIPAKLGVRLCMLILFTASAFGQLTEQNPVDELMEQVNRVLADGKEPFTTDQSR